MSPADHMSSVKLEECARSDAVGLSRDGAHPKRWFHMSPIVLERVLHVSFFLLGMGLMAPLTAILQTMDYLNIFFAQYYPSRTLYTSYNTCNLIALVVLFKWGDRLWPNKRSRMVTGYSLYTVILMALPLMDFIIVDHARHLEPRLAVELAFTMWALGSCIAGFSDAFISTVAYSQAASIGQRYTHAFVGGRATSGLVMAALRCISKGALRQNLTGLRQSTSIYVLIAALIVLLSVLIAGVLLPKLGPQIEMMNQLREADAHAAQHVGKCAYCRLRRQQRQLANLPPAATCKSGLLSPRKLALHGNTLAGQAKSVAALPIPPAGPPDSQLPTWGSMIPLIKQRSNTLIPAVSLDHSHARHAASRGSCPGSHFSNTCDGRHSAWGSRLNVETSHDLEDIKHKQGVVQVLEAALPIAEKSSDSVTSRASSGATLIPHSKQQFSIAEESSDCGSPSSQTLSLPGSHHGLTCSSNLARSSSQPSTPPSTCVDADVVVLTGKDGVQLAAADKALLSPTAAAKDQHMVVYLQSYMAAAHSVASELSTDSDVCCTCGTSKDIIINAGSESGDSSDSSSIGDSWWALLKIVWPFCLAVQPAPMTTATILPLNLSSQVANWPVVTAARWHVQIMMVTVQMGFFLGSAVIPIKTPRRPRVTLLAMACCMFLFAPCFAAALMVHARPWVFLAMALTMHTYSGYMTSTVFCVASQGFESKVAVRVQQLLVLSMGASYVVGSCVSWIWVFIGRS